MGADNRVAEVQQAAAALEDKLAAMQLRAEAAEAEKASIAEGLKRKGHEQEEASDAALQALAEKRCDHCVCSSHLSILQIWQ